MTTEESKRTLSRQYDSLLVEHEAGRDSKQVMVQIIAISLIYCVAIAWFVQSEVIGARTDNDKTDGFEAFNCGVITQGKAPWYFVAVQCYVKFIGTNMVFKMLWLKSGDELVAAWSKNDTSSIMKRIVALAFQSAFVAMATLSLKRDLTLLSALNGTCWTNYQCWGTIWTSSPNFVASWSLIPQVAFAYCVFCGVAEDPRPHGFLQNTEFFMSFVYGSFMVFLYILAWVPVLITNMYPGIFLLLFMTLFEILKFAFFTFWRDLFKWDLSMLAADAWDCSMVLSAFAVMCIPSLLAGCTMRLLAWWYGMSMKEEMAKYLERNNEEQMPLRAELNEVVKEHQASPNPDQSALHSRMHQVLSQRIFSTLRTPINSIFFPVIIGTTMVMPGPLITRVQACMYNGGGLYECWENTLTERTMLQYIKHVMDQTGDIVGKLNAVIALGWGT